MLVPSAFVKLPSEEGCYNGEIVMGGSVAQMASALAQLSNCKFLGQAHYQFSHTTYGGWSGVYLTGSRLYFYARIFTAYKGYEYNLLYQSTALSERVAVLIQYASKRGTDTPDITVEVRQTTGNSYTGTVIDYGIKFTELESHGEYSFTAADVFSGVTLDMPPTNTSATTVIRPLYIPSANRGELLNFKVTVNNVSISAVHIYDVYQVEVTP